MTLYRSGVVGVFINSEGKLLIAERSDVRGAWQFPQGGVEAGESFSEAVKREMKEELGITSVEIVGESVNMIRYEFPEHKKPFADTYVGQEQKWFLLKTHSDPALDQADGEFVSWQWSEPAQAIELVVDWKKEAYEKGLVAIGVKV